MYLNFYSIIASDLNEHTCDNTFNIKFIVVRDPVYLKLLSDKVCISYTDVDII